MLTYFQHDLAAFKRGRLGRHRQVAAAGVLLLTAAAAVECQAELGLSTPIVLAQVPVRSQRAAPDWDGKGLVRAAWFEGARLVVLSPAGQLRLLTEGFQSACEDVSP